MKIIVAGLGAGLALGAMFLFEKGVTAKSVLVLLLVFFLIGVSFGLVGSAKAIIAALLAAGGPFLIGSASIIVDIARDPTSHNLWPFEIVGEIAMGVLPAAGFLVGYVVKRLASPPAKAAFIPAGCALALALLSPWLAVLIDRHHQDHAVRMLQELWKAERAYAAQDSAHRFTCEGPSLPGFEQRHWFARTEMGLQARDHFQDGAYWFSIWCGPLSRGDTMAISAAPAGTGEGTVYCISESGAIHNDAYDNSCEHSIGRSGLQGPVAK